MQVREFANYLDALLARLDQGGGWCGVFWERDPDGMQACLDGREMPPWDVVEALLQDLATAYGPQVAGAETERARALHAAALVAYDARPDGRDALEDRFDVMLREQRYAIERQAELGRLLASATTQEEADALRLDLAWARDDHARATRRCAEIRSRMTYLDRRTTDQQAQAIRREAVGEGAVIRTREEFRAEGAGTDVGRPDGRGAGGAPHGASHDAGRGGGAAGPEGRGPGGARSTSQDAPGEGRNGGGSYGSQSDGHGSAPARSDGPGASSDGQVADGPGSYGERASSTEQPDGPASHGEHPDGLGMHDGRGARDRGFPQMPSRRDHDARPAAAATGWLEAAEETAAGIRDGREARRQAPAGPSLPDGSAHPVPGAYGAHPGSGAHSATSPAYDPRLRTTAPPQSHPGYDASAPQPTSTDAPVTPQPAPAAKQRKRRRSSARFAGMTEGTAAPVAVPPTAVPDLPMTPMTPVTPEVGGRTQRGARFAGAARADARADALSEPGAESLDAGGRREAVRTVERLMRLRVEGRSGEAHALLIELAYWPAARYPLLAMEMQRAGLGADWATLLWEAASLPADRLVAAADALVEAGRSIDGEQILRQGVGRPAAEVGKAVLALATEGRHREVRALLDAYVRVRTPEEAARSAEPDPDTLVPLLVEAAQGVSDERHWDLVHALRVAGFSA
ncbi:hypothetical protein M2271_002444 [Streptomyces sp. LBL]|nr:hypothetical protein [Streptomyces sp. LBL]